MPRINTDNYDTVASWNGSQDLFVVEQPDGTKVATPAMVKQFIEAGDFEATGEVKDGHGNKLSDIPKMHIVHFEVTISDMTAWGSVYEKGFNVDISSLQLTNQPRFISAELLNPGMGGWLRGFTINDTNTSIGAVFTRPTIASGAIRGNVLIIE
jgi:hypothetical protein